MDKSTKIVVGITSLVMAGLYIKSRKPAFEVLSYDDNNNVVKFKYGSHESNLEGNFFNYFTVRPGTFYNNDYSLYVERENGVRTFTVYYKDEPIEILPVN